MVQTLQQQVKEAGRPRALYIRSLRLEGFCHFELGRALSANENFQEAVDSFRRNFAVRDQLVQELPKNMYEARELCTGCIRLMYALYRVRKGYTPDEFKEASELASRADGIIGPLADHDKANLFWQAESGRSALAMAFIERIREKPEKAREWILETLRRMQNVPLDASPSIILTKAGAFSYLAMIEGDAHNIAGACDHWQQAIQIGFQSALAFPSWEKPHEEWQFYIKSAVEYMIKHAPDRIGACLTPLIEQVEKEISRQGASLLWRISAVRLYRSLAHGCRAVKDMPAAARANRRALELASEMFLSGAKVEADLIILVTKSSADMVDSAPGAEDRRYLARQLIRGSGPAALLEPAGKWRADWANNIYDALKIPGLAGAAALAREARDAIFPEGAARVRIKTEKEAFDRLDSIKEK